MEIKNAHLAINARTKKELNALPTFTECELNMFIGHHGDALIGISQKSGNGPQRGEFGRIATLAILNPDDMEQLAKGLLALANAVREIGE